MTNIASVVAMRGLLRLLSGRGEDVTASRARDLRNPPRGFSIRSGAGLIRWAPSGDLPAA